jgi:hypothetical protein
MSKKPPTNVISLANVRERIEGDFIFPFRELLSLGFAGLNNRGIFAAQNWFRCQASGHHAIKLILPKVETYCFWHRQDEDNLSELEEKEEPPYVFLSWGGDGARICKILRRSGMDVDWDGSDGARIRVSCPRVSPPHA